MNLALSIHGKAKVEWNRECDLAGIRDAGQIPIGEQKTVTQFWTGLAKAAEPANNTGSLKTLHRKQASQRLSSSVRPPDASGIR